MNPLRSALAVLGGAMLLGFMDQTLERTLVSAIAAAPPADDASYMAIRNRPLVLAVTLVTHALAATLAGYILAKIAGAHEVRHAIGTAVALTIVYAVAFASENAMLPPAWVRAAILVITPPALVAGATVRAQARAIQAEQADTPRPEERS
jgi:hypothetical protein